MGIKLSLLKKVTSFFGILSLSLCLAQVNDDFTGWASRANGNYNISVPAGNWILTNCSINKSVTGTIPVPGTIELAKVNTSAFTDKNGGTLTTPTILKGGASSITVNLLRRTSSVTGYYAQVDVQKSTDGANWISLQTITSDTSVSTPYVIPVNDYSDNLRFRIVSISKLNSSIVDVVKVSHSFILSSNESNVCPDTPVILTAEGSAPFTYTWTSSTGGNLVQTTGSTVTANPSQDATYTATGTYTNAYGTVTDTKVITVNTKETPTATLTGSGTIDTEPGSVNLQVVLTGTGPWSINYTANSTPQTITGITSSPYIFAVSPEVNTTYTLTSVTDANCNGNGVGTASVLVNKTVWRDKDNVIEWSNGVPNANLNTYIYEPFVTSTNGAFVAKNLTISNNGLLTVSPNTVITADQYINNSTADRFVVESDANLMQNTELTNIGDITVRRVANMAKMHYTFWSSPVANQNLYSFSDGGLVGGTPKSRFYIYNESNDLFVGTGLNDAYSFRTGQGYAIRGKDSYNADFNIPAPYSFMFAGVPNNGNLAYQYLKWTNSDHGFNLVGNPYPSNLDFDALYDANSSLIYGTAYFWTNQQYIPGQQGGNYSGSNYAIYNRSGGVPATFQDGVESPTPTQYIKVGQGFLVQSMGGANGQPLQFTNDMRSYSPSSIFFNKQESKSKDRYWLNLKSPSDINNTILVTYAQGATDGYERTYDADLLVLGSDAFYTTNGSAKLAIQGRKYPLSSDDVVTLGTKCFETGNYTITLKAKEGIFNTEQNIYLKDNKLNKVINLTLDASYTFAASKGTDNTRFEVIYQDVISFDSLNKTSGSVSVAKDDIEIVIKDTKENITAVNIYDASGKLIRSISDKNSKEIRINTAGFTKGIYILKITSEKGVTTKKVIF